MEKELNLNRISAYQKRQFVSQTADFSNLSQVQEIYQKLLDFPIKSKKDLEKWILQRSEVEAVLDQVSAILYINMTCQTDDKDKAKAYQDFIETIVPAVKPLGFELNKKLLKAAAKFELNKKRYGLHLKKKKIEVSLFIEKNVPLQTKVDLLSQDYQTICGAMMVNFQGKEQTLPQMGKFLLEPDRKLREESWRLVAQRRLKDKDRLDEIFDEMLKLRHEVAVNAGFKNYRDYTFKAFNRFDYTPNDCKTYHRSVERCLVPIYKKLMDKRKQLMKLDELRPWDTAVDPLGRSALKPFNEVSELVSGCQKIFRKMDKELGKNFDEMVKLGVLDLASRKGKAPGGYQSTLPEARKPFIFMNAVGVDQDMYTLFHECGHAFHALACAHDPLVDYRHGPMEFCEVASMAMEMLVSDYLNLFYKPQDANRSVLEHFEDILYTLIWVAVIDCFQHWIYENPKHSAAERVQAWEKIHQRFGNNFVDWKELEQEHKFLWQRQLHIFEYPFYYIEYGIAQLGALQVWVNAKKDSKKALRLYKNGLSLGGAETLPNIYKAAGIKFDFSEKIIQKLADEVNKELELLSKN